MSGLKTVETISENEFFREELPRQNVAGFILCFLESPFQILVVMTVWLTFFYLCCRTASING